MDKTYENQEMKTAAYYMLLFASCYKTSSSLMAHYLQVILIKVLLLSFRIIVVIGYYLNIVDSIYNYYAPSPDGDEIVFLS